MNFLKRIWVHFKRVQRGDDNKERKKKQEINRKLAELRKEINEKNKCKICRALKEAYLQTLERLLFIT